jgi:Flp pilus assembly protein TadD
MKHIIIFFTGTILFFSCSTDKKRDNAALQVAVSDFKKGDLTNCEAKLHEYTKKFPNDYQGWSFLGTVALELENDSLAQRVLDKAILLNPKDHKALTGLGILARKNKDYDKAADYYNKAIIIAPTYGKAYSSLLIVELKKGNSQAAVDLGEKASGLCPNELGIKGNLAVAYHITKQFTKRDSLVKEIDEKGYSYIDYLKLFFDGKVTLDDF